jgi:tetratricopeptide (TPR) repeat protein
LSADGVPLFVEELTKAVLESAAQGDRVAAVLATTSLTALSVPATLHASLMARLDRLGPEPKEIAQIGAVLGREFGYKLIEPVAQRDRRELQAALGQLSDAGLLLQRDCSARLLPVQARAGAGRRLWHVIARKTAGITCPRRGRAGAKLRRSRRAPARAARPSSDSGRPERAVEQWLKAGQHAAARFAHLEAIRHCERGLAALTALPEGPIRDGWEIELQLARGPSLFTTKGFVAAEAAEAYTRAGKLAEQRSNPRQLFMAVNGLWQSANGAGMILDCRRLSNRLQQLTAADNADEGLRLQAHHSAWATCLFAGELAAAREHGEVGRRLYDPERHCLHHLRYGGHDPGTCACYLGAQVHWLLGYPEQGLALGSEALALAERITHPFSFAIALQYNSMLHLDRGEPELALQRLATAEALVAEQRLGFVLEPQLLRGAALMAQGALGEAVACLHEGLAGRNGSTRLKSYGLARLADALTRRGEHDAALAAAREGLVSVEKTGHRQWEAELLRFEGIALCGLNRIQEGQSALEAALRVARRQQAKANELRAATSLARLWGEHGRRSPAHDLLAPVYGWFTEGFDTADLIDAKALLDELA